MKMIEQKLLKHGLEVKCQDMILICFCLFRICKLVCRDRQIVTSGSYRFRTKDNVYIVLQTIFEPFINPWNDELEIIVARNKTK